MTPFKYLILLFSVVYLSSCDFEKTARMHENLPKSSGKPGQIIMVMDSTQWQGKLGETLRSTFESIVPYLPHKEPRFSLNYVKPKDFQSILKRQKNIMFVTVLNSNKRGDRILKRNFTGKSLKMVEQDPSLFMLVKKDEFARDQLILHLFGETEDVLISNIKANADKLVELFEQEEEKRLNKALFSVKYEKGISNRIREKLQCDIKIPLGYEIAMEGDGFMWVRNFTPDIDKSIWISYKPYTSADMFSLDSLLKIRTELSKDYILYKPEDKESYLLTETDNFDVFRKEINFKGKYAVQLRGLWKVNKYYMGGPFISYAMVDSTTHRFYYVEGFVYSPGQPQRETMRELAAILKTFNVPVSPAKEKKK